MSETNNKDTSTLTADEIKLYDRQIRLWGLEAQTRMRHSRILVLNLTSIGVEVVKNLMLAGIGSLTLCDSSILTEQDLNGNFFVDASQVGQLKVDAAFDRIQDLNNRVKFSVLKESLPLGGKLSTSNTAVQKNIDPDTLKHYQNYDLVIATGLNRQQLSQLNQITRNLQIPLYASGGHGLYAYLFVDLIRHESKIELESNSNSTKSKVGVLNSVSEITNVEKTGKDEELKIVSTLKNHYRTIDEIFKSDKLNEFYKSEKKLKKITTVLPLILALFDYSASDVVGKDQGLDPVVLKFKAECHYWGCSMSRCY
ncbi:unnamed protein product [Ambrosiozyma monospora]|uniref:Unnamed protein product n=1 Tax=Ambrosiozyma monospora TaxID=43982 RepID=A0ACB5T031_AMBMO|nr:unnamed protein product [Ambrosiozyma monospora]